MLFAHGLAVLTLCATGGYALHRTLHRAFRPPRPTPLGRPDGCGVHHARGVTVPTANRKTLFGWYCPPLPAPPLRSSAEPAPALVAIHGWGGNADGLLPLAGLLQAEGYGLLLLDARCHGRSETDSFASLPRFAEDLSAGVDWLRQRPEIEPSRVAVMGHSVGAGAALLAGRWRDDLGAVISLAAFAHPEEVMRRTLASWHIPYRPLGWITNRYVEWIIGHKFRDIAPVTSVARQHAPVLLIHGTHDTVVPLSDMTRLHDAALTAGRQVAAVPLPGACHEGRNTETGASQMEDTGRLILAFLRQYLPTSTHEDQRQASSSPKAAPHHSDGSDARPASDQRDASAVSPTTAQQGVSKGLVPIA